jgi:hypothetical protein
MCVRGEDFAEWQVMAVTGTGRGTKVRQVVSDTPIWGHHWF